MANSLMRTVRKVRYAAEIRFPVVPEFLDRRGQIISRVHPIIRDHFKHWRSNPHEIGFTDTEQNPADEFLISPKKAALIMEDPGSSQRFVDNSIQWLNVVYENLGEWIEQVDRIGFRILEVVSLQGLRTYDTILQQVLDAFHRNPQIGGLKVADSMVKIVHENGFYQVGPTKDGDPWIAAVFKRPEHNTPKVGVGLDIDSFQKSLRINTIGDLQTAFAAVHQLTTTVEELVCGQLEQVSEQVLA